jgi:hypothetical protein
MGLGGHDGPGGSAISQQLAMGDRPPLHPPKSLDSSLELHGSFSFLCLYKFILSLSLVRLRNRSLFERKKKVGKVI